MTIFAIIIFILAIFALFIGYSCEYVELFWAGICVLVFELIGVICYGVAYFPAKYICEKKAQMLDVEYKYDLYCGCFIKGENGWYEYSQQRVIK